ncbi:MAG: hypothetical protein RSA51_09320 [Niameybacter sp.]
MAKTYSGFTNKTMEKLLLDSGAFFKNYDVATDTFDTAVTAGKLIGATQGGGNFEAKPETRTVEIDGIKGVAKGMTVLDGWAVNIGANMAEFDTNSIALALGISKVDTTTNQDYDIVQGKNNIAEADYLENITWVGTLSGSEKPVIIQIYNALNIEGMALDFKDKANGVMKMTFKAHYTQEDLNTPPYKIYYPKKKA